VSKISSVEAQLVRAPFLPRIHVHEKEAGSCDETVVPCL